jgi:hypothetical protein
MPSTYTLNNGIELIGTGEQSGTWGDTTNTNLDLLDAALDGQVTITLGAAGSSGSPNALPITDGTASNGRNRMVVFADGADLGATAFVQLTPNDAEKIIYIRNSLSGSRSVILFQGTYNASNDYEVPAGTTAVVYFDGAGAGAVAANVFNNAHFDAINVVGTVTATTVTATTVNATTVDAVTVEFDNLSGTGAVSVTNILDEDNMASDSATALATQQSIKAYVDSQVGTVDTLAEILAIGNTTGATDIDVDGAQKVQFRDAAIYINSSVDGQLDIVADTEIQIAATTVDLNGNLDVSGTTLVTGVLTTTAATVFNGGFASNADSTLGTDKKVQFRDAAIYINSSVDGQLDIVADTEIQIAATTVDLNGALDVSGTLGVTGVLTATSLDISGDIDVDGTTNLDVVDIDGATQIDATVTVGVDDTGYDVKFFGATAGAYMLWDESADDLILGGAAGLSVNSTALVTGVLTTTAATVSNGGGQFNGAINVGVDDTGYDVKFFGATTGKSLLWDESADSLTVAGNLSVDGGTIKLDGNYPVGSGNVALGDAALDSNVSGASNVAIGADALTANTGSNNTAVGYQALSNNVNGQQNQAFGYLAMTTNISGSNNAAFGTGALQISTTSDNAAFGSGVTAVSGGALNSATTGTRNSAFGGGAAASTTSGSYNVAVGALALKSNTTADNNTAVGYQAGYSNTTGARGTFVGMDAGYTNSTASYNTGVGWSALRLNTTGELNTAMGDGTLQTNTTGSQNTGIGQSALNNNTTGSYNTALGRQSLFSNTTASYNTAVGYQAGYYGTTAEKNSLFGWASGLRLTSGSSNVAMGYSSLEYTTTGTGNVAIGYQALILNTTASNNTAVGYQAAYNNTTGISNSAFGREALLNSTTSNYNSAFGSAAGYTNVTGENNTYLGFAAGYSATGSRNTFVGARNGTHGSGQLMTTGSANTILGAFDGNQGGVDLRTQSNIVVLSDGDGNPRVVIDSSGSVKVPGTATGTPHTDGSGVAITASSGIFVGVSNAHAIIAARHTTAGECIRLQFGSSDVGSIDVSGSGTTYNTTSDYRLKENITSLTGAADRLAQIPVHRFNFIVDPDRTVDGFLAHDVQAIVPEAITGTKDEVDADGNPVYQGIDQSKLVPLLTAALQEALTEIASLKARLDAANL